MNRFRKWLIKQLGGIDRDEAENFAVTYLKPNGKVKYVAIQSYQVFMTNKTVARAPWTHGILQLHGFPEFESQLQPPQE